MPSVPTILLIREDRMTFTVLTVCTGNICRSPAMERLLARAVADAPEVRVHSGGTFAHDGEDMQPPMKRRVAAAGAAVDDFVAEQVTAAMIEEADLILTATRVHVADLLDEVPQAAERTFTIREIGRLLEHVDSVQLDDAVGADASIGDRFAAVVPLLDAARSSAGPAGRDDDVVDPYLLPESVYDESFAQISDPTEGLVELVRG